MHSNKKDWRFIREGPMSEKFSKHRSPCKRLAPSKYKGQAYIVTCKDVDNKEMTVGWTNSISGKPFINCVNKHPYWSEPRIERMPEHMITQ